MSLTEPARKNWTDDQVWEGIVRDCNDQSQKTVNCGSSLRRKAILEMNRRLKLLKGEKE